jgi:tetraacyldisaccharide 4'-kinase
VRTGTDQAYRELVRGERRGTVDALARGLLWVASGPYGAVVVARNRAFDSGLKRTVRAGCPVVSVGNITVGGTGKTPMVESVARRLRESGLRVVIASRGYGSGEGLNDEGLVLDANLPDVPHLQAPDRVALAKIAIEELEAEALVLDDGFQHRRLARDLDIVLLDALDPFGAGALLPRGLLREPIGSLRRADIVVLTRADLVDAEARSEIRRRAEGRAGALCWAEARHAPRDLIDSEGEVHGLAMLEGKSAVAFCGLGNPEGFRRTLHGLGVAPAKFRVFPDHHPYMRTDVDDLAVWAKQSGVDLVLTTQKDLVKLRTLGLGGVPLFAIRIGIELLTGAEILAQRLDEMAVRAAGNRASSTATVAMEPAGKDLP